MKDKSKAKKVNHGSGLIFAVVLLFVILGMVITLSSITVLETKMNQKTKSSVGAFYNSESGVEWALNQIATKDGTAQISTIGSCPFTGCSVLFLDKDGKVLATSATIDQVKAVRSVGSQNGETQRAIEAAVASGGGGSFIYYCNLTFSGDTGTLVDDRGNAINNICNSNPLPQGYCPSGFKQIYDLGTWGYCYGSGSGNDPTTFRPPGGRCYLWWTAGTRGNAYVCSQ